MGVIIKDCKREVMATKTYFKPHCFQPKFTEAIAFRESIHMTHHFLLDHAKFEIDCQELYASQKANDMMQCTYLSTILQDCKDLLSHRANNMLIHMNRIGNIIAHCLARLTFTFHDFVLIEEVPFEIQTLKANIIRRDVKL